MHDRVVNCDVRTKNVRVGIKGRRHKVHALEDAGLSSTVEMHASTGRDSVEGCWKAGVVSTSIALAE